MSVNVVFSPYPQASALLLARASVLMATGICFAAAFAQDAADKSKPESSGWGLGLAVVNTQTAYKGVDRQSRALPMFSFENQYVKLSGPNLELKLPGLAMGDSQRLKFGLVTQLFGGGGYQASDSSALAGMAERKSSVWAGAKAEWENDWADVKLEWLGDASNTSKGQRVGLGLERKWQLGPKLMLVPQAGVEWMDSKYVDYYYGVRPGEVTAGRAAYSGSATLNGDFSLTGIYRFDKNQSLMLNVGVKALGLEIRNSPIVGLSTENRVMLGYMYRF
jgi:MipA family protein